jgi:hypothetical protein
MKIEKVSYQKLFSTGPYVNEKIGMEAQIDEGESPERALSEIKHSVEEWFRINGDHYSELPVIQVKNY